VVSTILYVGSHDTLHLLIWLTSPPGHSDPVCSQCIPSRSSLGNCLFLFGASSVLILIETRAGSPSFLPSSLTR
jgi:hypothetical protein